MHFYIFRITNPYKIFCFKISFQLLPFRQCKQQLHNPQIFQITILTQLYSILPYNIYSFSELDLPSTSFFSNKRRSSKHIHDKIGEGPMKLILNQDLLREALLATLKLNASRILQHFYFKGFFTKSLKVEGIFSLHMLMMKM